MLHFSCRVQDELQYLILYCAPDEETDPEEDVEARIPAPSKAVVPATASSSSSSAAAAAAGAATAVTDMPPPKARSKIKVLNVLHKQGVSKYGTIENYTFYTNM